MDPQGRTTTVLGLLACFGTGGPTRLSGVVSDLPPELLADLKAVDYGYDASDAILLERKDDMRKRGLASPDDGDALALTFAHPVTKKDWAEERRFEEGLEKLRRWVR